MICIFLIIENQCKITNEVLFTINLFITFCIINFILVSTNKVASSKINTDASFNITLSLLVLTF